MLISGQPKKNPTIAVGLVLSAWSESGSVRVLDTQCKSTIACGYQFTTWLTDYIFGNIYTIASFA